MLQLPKLNSESPAQKPQNLWKLLSSVMWHHKVTDNLEEPAATIFMVLCYNRFLWSVGNILWDYSVFFTVTSTVTSDLKYLNRQIFIISGIYPTNLVYYLILTHTKGPCNFSAVREEKHPSQLIVIS